MKKLKEKISILLDEEASTDKKKQNKLNIGISFKDVGAYRYSHISLEDGEVFIRQPIPRRDKLEKNFTKEALSAAFSFYEDDLESVGFFSFYTPYIIRYYTNIQKHKGIAEPLKQYIKNKESK